MYSPRPANVCTKLSEQLSAEPRKILTSLAELRDSSAQIGGSRFRLSVDLPVC